MRRFIRYILQDHILRYRKLDFIHIVGHFFLTPSFRLIIIYRMAEYFEHVRLIGGIMKLLLIKQCNKRQITLSPQMSIGPGLMFPHEGPVTINLDSKIGANCSIHPNVLIGGNLPKGAPVIGDNCFIGNGSKLIGNVHVGNYCFLAPGAIVTKDMPDGTLIGSGLNNILKIGGGKSMSIYTTRNSANSLVDKLPANAYLCA